MDLLYETREGKVYLIYKLNREEKIDNLSLGMISNNHIPGLASTRMIKRNNEDCFEYDITSKTTLERILAGDASEDTIIKIVRNILNAMITADEYMIDKNSVVFDVKNIYLDVTTKDVELISIPILNGKYNIGYNKFIVNILNNIVRSHSEYKHAEEILNHIINDITISAEDLKKFIDGDNVETQNDNLLTESNEVENDQFNEIHKAIEQESEKQIQNINIENAINNALNTDNEESSLQNGIEIQENQWQYQLQEEQPMSEEQIEQPEPVQCEQPMQYEPADQYMEQPEPAQYEQPMQYEPADQYMEQPEPVQCEQPMPEEQIEQPEPAQYEQPMQYEKQMPEQQMDIPGSSDMNSAQFQPEIQQASPEKKKMSLYDRLFHKKKKNKNMQPEQDFNVPGNDIAQNPVSQQMEMKGENVSDNEMMQQETNDNAESNTDESSAAEQGVQNNNANRLIAKQILPSMPDISKPNYGETVVLNSFVEDTAGETTILNQSMLNTATPPYIIRSKTRERIDILTSPFKIGKENSSVDYFIADNTAISRKHAEIISENEKYYIIDTNSKNHSYVNGKMIPADKQIEIFSGDKIYLANEEFTFFII